ncbi:vWA domain-containing protein [Oricola cellulosilytica]|uniref:VWA domain-containing protein n=1 Tax=Oricola cellulosilytica TaxID=1429082 RepID=A0A4V6N6B5_9HYPH|nr:VWA domain-containing protein [Oricola cellulosilytica]TCD14557.1 VWA domain-containing protein [Oricola cellulosilytica]
MKTVSSTSRSDPHPEGRLADNIVYFARTLRKAGLKIGPAAVNDAIEAVMSAGIGTRDDFYWTLHSVLVTRHEDTVVFDEAFRLFWRSRELIEKMLAMFSPMAPDTREREKKRAGESRVADAMFEGHKKRKQQEQAPEIEVDARMTFSEREILRDKDFSQMSAAEIAEAKRAISELRLPADQVRTRRQKPSNRKRTVDPRRTMRSAMRTGGDLVIPQFREPRMVQPPLVILADISGSMSQYSRVFLHFLHAVTEKRRRVHTFLFGTRLTNVTRQMRGRDIDAAIDGAARAVEDWSGGTRIGETLATFNRQWSRRVLSQGAVLLLITDGLERDAVEGLDHEMERLHKSCRRLIWLNPLLRYEGFRAKAKGVRAMLPHVDEFRPVHSLNSIADLCLALGEGGAPYHRPRPPMDWLRELDSAA